MSDFWRNVIPQKIKKEKSSGSEPEKVSISKERILKMGFHVWRQFDDPYYAGFAPQIAYYFLMSSVPMLILLTQVLGLFDVSMDFIRDWLDAHLSSEMSSVVSSMFTASSTTISNVFLVLLAMWSASSLSYSLSRLVTYTLTNGRYRFTFFTERLKAIPLAMVTILVIASTLIIYVYGDLLTRRLITKGPLLILIRHLKAPVLALIFFAVILATYYLTPRIRVPFAAIIPGSIVATVGIMIVTIIYSVYTNTASNYNILYGAFANIIALMLWFFLISWVLCIGMMFNRSWDIHMEKNRLTYARIKEYVYRQYPSNGDEMYNKLIIGDYDITDPSLDSVAVRFSRKFDPGYDEKREREIEALEAERRIRLKVEQDIADQYNLDHLRYGVSPDLFIDAVKTEMANERRRAEASANNMDGSAVETVTEVIAEATQNAISEEFSTLRSQAEPEMLSE